MTLEEAFEDCIKTKWVLLPDKNRRKWKQRMRMNLISEKKMKEILFKHGYRVIFVEKWGKI